MATQEQYDPNWIINQTVNPCPSPEREFLFWELLELYSNEAKQVIKLVLDSPTELIDIATKSKTSRSLSRFTLERYLHHQGWPLSVIEQTFNEIKTGLRELEIGKTYSFNPMRTIFGLRREKNK